MKKEREGESKEVVVMFGVKKVVQGREMRARLGSYRTDCKRNDKDFAFSFYVSDVS